MKRDRRVFFLTKDQEIDFPLRYERGESLIALAREVGCCRNTMREILVKLGTDIRERGNPKIRGLAAKRQAPKVQQPDTRFTW